LHSQEAALKRLIPFALLLLLVARPASAGINQLFEEQGVSPRDTAMGNAFTGVAEGWPAAYYNPAGLYQLRGGQLAFGYKYVDPEVYLHLEGYRLGEGFTDYPTTKLFLLGIASDLRFPRVFNAKLAEHISFGLAFGISDYIKSFTTYWTAYVPYFFRYNDRMVSLMSLYVGFSVKIVSCLSLGAGFVAAPSDTYNAVSAKTVIRLPEGDFSTVQGVVNRTKGKVEPQVGLMFKPPIGRLGEMLTLGVVWRDEVSSLDTKGTITTYTDVQFADGSTYRGLEKTEMPLVALTGFSPMQVAAGLGIRPMHGMLIAVDEIWKQWSRWMNFWEWHPDPRFEDTWQTRLGAEYEWRFHYQWFRKFAVRGGWYFEPSPVPDQNNQWNVLDNDKNVVSTGVGMEIGNIIGIFMVPAKFDVAYQHHILSRRYTSNSEDPSYPALRTGGYVYNLTATLTLVF